MKNSFIWTILFWILLLTNVAANLLVLGILSDITKILLMPLLMIILIQHVDNGKTRLFKWTVIALFFSWLGDMLLIFQSKNDIFFLLGLGAFLMAHVSYIIGFGIARTTNPSLEFKSWLIPGALLLIYLIFLFNGIGPGLNNYVIPVVFYAIAISGMFLMAYSRLGRASRKSFILILMGACFFILSDSLIAINKFWLEISNAGAWIMLTYGTAQFMIIGGLISHTKS